MSEELEPQQTPQPEKQPEPQHQFPPQNGGFTGFTGGFGGMQQALPNATAVLVLGILSIVTCCCYGIIGLILAIIALILAKKDRALYSANTASYTEGSYKNLNAGRVCAIIGLIFSILYLLFIIFFIAMFGFAGLSDQQEMLEALKGLQ